MIKQTIYILFLFLVCFLFNCSSKQQTKESEDIFPIISNEINVSAAVNAVKDKVYLSEWVDSVSYIPLETRSDNLLGGGNANITPEYIFCDNHCFDWQGNYLFPIGKKGQGPGEDPGWGYELIFVDNFFYSRGMKFIEYDENGIYTGKEKDLFRVENGNVVGKFVNLGGFKRVGSTMVGFDFPQDIYFFNTDFEIVDTYPVMDWPHPYHSTFYEVGHSLNHYKDGVVFYNYFTDTVYHITENALYPRWIIKLNQEDKLCTDFLYSYKDFLLESFDYFQNGKLDEAPICKLSDNRLNISSVYENDNYLFFICQRFMFNRELRGLPPGDPPVMISFDKSTGKMNGGKKIIDDIGGMDTFFPSWGVFEDKMLSFIWPYELEEFITEKQEKGQKVDSRLLELMGKVDIEDNPVMIVAYLKK
ncbi:MAG: 6-bladed beta-propeller [Tannerellaceae bacterium]|nr:6-bladed beta-propeller [Tannerellaceae bacterium]